MLRTKHQNAIRNLLTDLDIAFLNITKVQYRFFPESCLLYAFYHVADDPDTQAYVIEVNFNPEATGALIKRIRLDHSGKLHYLD